MGRGIKASKNIVFDVNYEIYTNSGPTKEESETTSNDVSTTTEPAWSWIDTGSDYYLDYYVVGVGQEQFPEAGHNPVMVDEVGSALKVYLEEKDGKQIWYKHLTDETDDKTNRVFSDAITEISSDEFDDLNLKAKWTQSLFKKEDSFKINLNQQFVTFENNNVIFSWSMTDGGN